MNNHLKNEPVTHFFPALTGVRWIAALMVFTLHYNTAPKGSLMYYICSGGSVGVSLFFVLSGFLITHKYKDEFQLKWAWFSNYLFKRFARIYPAYFLISVVILLLKLFYTQEQLPISAVIFHFLLLQGYFEQSFAVLIAPSWSLTVEEAFYLLAPILIVFSRKSSILLAFAAMLITGFLILWISAALGANEFVHTKTYLLDRTFFGRSLEFLVGAGLSFYISRFGRFRGKWITYSALLLIIGFMYLQGGQFRSYFHSPIILWIIKLRNYIFPWLAAAFFYGLIAEHTLLRRFLSLPFIQLLGKSSYVFYLIHLSILATVALRFLPENIFCLYLWVLAISIGVYLCWEQPMRTFLLKKRK